MKNKTQKIRFLKDYQSYKKGDIVEITNSYKMRMKAGALIQEKVAEKLNEVEHDT